MKGSQRITLLVLLVLIAAGVAGLILSSNSPQTPVQTKRSNRVSADTVTINHKYLDTARRLSALATTPEEQQVAQDALRSADHESDLEFAAALDAAGRQSTIPTPEVQNIQAKIRRLGTAIETKQAEVKQVAEALKAARANQRDALAQQLDVGQAELNFYKELLDDTKDDLVAAGGDPHSRVQQLVDEHNAASHAADSIKITPLSQPPAVPSNLLARWSNWNSIRRKQNEIVQAQQEASNAADALALQHGPLAKQVEAEQAQRNSTPGLAAGTGQAAAAAVHTAPPTSPPSPQAAPESKQSTATSVALLHRLAGDRKTLALLDRRVKALKSLSQTYDQWILLIKAQQKAALHGIILSVLSIVLLMLLVFFIIRVTEHFSERLKLENKQRTTLQTIIRASVRVVTVIFILIIIFGPPNQLSTVLGLAGAGLTVVLKDFIVSFLGWFVLMGRHGIRVGDWVEINGVRGEVIEISLLRTVLLETGNWSDSGQPTGRQVAFLNQYAVDGYYFNFSTSGQWLWDELQVLIPKGSDPYPIIEKIRATVETETETNTRLADLEWQRISRRYGVRTYTAQPTVNLKPTDGGVVVLVRYVTSAEERTEVRFRLNHAMVKLLHTVMEELPTGGDVPVATPAQRAS